MKERTITLPEAIKENDNISAEEKKIKDLARRVYDVEPNDPDYTVETIEDSIINNPVAVIEHLIEIMEG